MSRGNMLLGMASGKVGDIVFYRSNGQQQTRSKAASVKNPRTMAQSTQRVLMKNVVLAYSALKSICDHSFQNVQYGAASQRKFMRDNLDKMRTVAAATNGGWERMPGLVPVGGSGFPAFEFLVSQGSLPFIEVDCTDNNMEINAGNADSRLTYQQVCDQLGLQRGDQLTFIGVYGDAQNYEVKTARVILDPYDNGQPADMSVSMFLNTSTIQHTNPENKGYIKGTVTQAGTAIYLTTNVAPHNLIACAVIASRKNGADWLRSEQNLVVSSYGIQLNNTLGNNAAQASAGTLTIDVDDPYYLNGAESTSQASNYDAYALIDSIFAGRGYSIPVSDSGTTHVEANDDGSPMDIKINCAFSNNKKAAYKIGGGAWTVISGDFTDNVLQGSINAVTDDVVSIAVGHMENSTFVPESIWGGTITVEHW